MRPFDRRLRWLELRAWAERAGRLDEAGALGSFGVKLLGAARRQAASFGINETDTDEAIFEGLDRGRAS